MRRHARAGCRSRAAAAAGGAWLALVAMLFATGRASAAPAPQASGPSSTSSSPAAAAANPAGAPGGSAAAPPSPAAVPGSAGHGPAVLLDRLAVRFYAPETGGSPRPRFISERTLAFEARLEAAADGVLAGVRPDGVAVTVYQERYVRAALETHVAEDLLASLQAQSGVEPAEIVVLAQAARAALIFRVGGEDALHKAAEIEGIDGTEIDGMLRRKARAAYYVDHEIAPLLHPSEEQLREVYRTSAHPYKGKKFDAIREDLSRWFVSERVHVAETAYLQTARNRVRIILIPK